MQVLYHKYRPKTFEEIEGQEHGAYLRGRACFRARGACLPFCGPRGTGKTTMARLLAKSLNCAKYQQKVEGQLLTTHYSLLTVPCNSCHPCTEINEGRSLDLIEIDAASNRESTR